MNLVKPINKHSPQSNCLLVTYLWKNPLDLVLYVPFLSEEGFFLILMSYVNNSKQFGNQYLMENLDKVESPLKKSGISSIIYYVQFWECGKIQIIQYQIIQSILYIVMYYKQYLMSVFLL